MSATPDLFEPRVLEAWAKMASSDAFVAKNAILADLRFGLRNADTDQAVWLAVEGEQVSSGTGLDSTAFAFEGRTDAFSELARGFPFNRLIRQHRLTIVGDMRRCVQNWLLIYAVTRLTGHLYRQRAED
ncbi:hypothetical protein [Bordetella genomosp. 12]|uniref:SCP2 domain-containing protein n=1 Tax=Bordetella genomosp. 12 TaxID=463035 RepID=A0A261VLD0_9BORD|nr:hypothetical protein [Bordetella genomosp. 12]OZI74869.1 hypothetical protein CAL22_10570 [Bordetella genomosp. 12]